MPGRRFLTGESDLRRFPPGAPHWLELVTDRPNGTTTIYYIPDVAGVRLVERVQQIRGSTHRRGVRMAREPRRPEHWPSALVSIYRSEYASMVRLGYLLCGSRDVAEEAVQDAFVSVRSRWADITSSPGGYVRTAVVREVQQRQRRSNTAKKYDQLVQADLSTNVSSSSVEFADLLDQLSWPQRVAIVGRYWLASTDDEIARLLDCRPATVRSHLRRGLAVLRKELEPR